MKIVIDARFWGVENGGLGRYTREFIKSLTQLDSHNTYFLLLRAKDLNDVNLPSNFKKVLVNQRHYSIFEQLIVPLVLVRIKPDLVHFLHFNVPVFYFGKYVVTIHDILMHKGVGRKATTLPFWKYTIKRFFYRLVFDSALTRARKIIVPSKHVLKEITTTYKNLDSRKINVLYEGYPKPNGKNVDNKKQLRQLLYVGNAYPHKNVSGLLLAAKHLRKQNINFKLTLVLPQDYFLEDTRKQIGELDLGNCTTVFSKLSDQEVFELYSSSGVFVYPSFSEGFGLQGLEALSHKTLLCASDIEIFREIYKDAAIYFDPKKPEKIAESVIFALKLDKHERNKYFKAFERVSKNYDWVKMAKSIKSIYENCNHL